MDSKSNARGSSSHWQRAKEREKQSIITRCVMKLRQKSLPVRLCYLFAGGFALGAAVEMFACKTGLYNFVTDSKTKRRHELDEFVAQFQEDMAEWQKEDMQRAAAQRKVDAVRQEMQRAK